MNFKVKVCILSVFLCLQTVFLGFTSTRLWAEYLFSTSQWRASIDANPRDWRHRFQLARALLQLEQLEQAAYHFAYVLRYSPGNFEAANNLGVAYYKMGESKQAMLLFRYVLAIWPGHEEARENLEILNGHS